MRRISVAAGRVMVVTAIAVMMTGDLSPVFAAQLRDSTRIPIRLIGGVTSDTAKEGQTLQFVAMSDIVIDDLIVIRRDTPVYGVVVKARRMHWGFRQRRPRLAFRLTYTTTAAGQVITLRSTPLRQVPDQVVVQGGRPGHALLWGGGAEIFEAYVDGDYEV